MRRVVSIAFRVTSVFFAVCLALPPRAGADCEGAPLPRTAEDWIARADCRRENGDPEAALADYEQARKLTPRGDRSLYYGLGRAYEDLDLHGEALEAFRKAEKLGATDADLLFHVGLAYENLYSYDLAVLNFRRAITLDPRDNRAQRNIGYVLTQQGEHELAIPFFKEAIGIDARDDKAWLNLGVTYVTIEEITRAELKRLSFMAPSGEVDPDDPVWRRSDELRTKLKEFDWFDEGMAAMREAVRLEPNEAVYWYTLGTSLSVRRDLMPEAVEALAKATSLKPDYYEALRNLTLYQTRLERHGDAYETASRLEKVVGPGDLWLQVHLADLELKLGEWGSAERRYQSVLAVYPEEIDAHMGLAIGYRRESRDAESDEHLRRAIELRPDLKPLLERAVANGP